MTSPGTHTSELAGPWPSAFYFQLQRPARSKSNHRRSGNRSTARQDLAKLASFDLDVLSAARASRPANWVASDPGVPVSARPKILIAAWARTLLDVGNIDKSLLDALQGPVMASDAQVIWSLCGGQRSATDQYLLVLLAQLQADATLPAQFAAAAGLLQHMERLIGRDSGV